jgi:isoquinoline 1-oxidoreductase subunit beta
MTPHITAHTIENVSRRQFLQASAGLTLGFCLPSLPAAAAAATPTQPLSFVANAFLRIGLDDTITVISKHLEMGQGSYTGLATIVAEELDANWASVRVEGAPADASRYNNLAWGPAQGTGGSSSIANSWEQLRKAGATARAMLLMAAAQQWQVEADTLSVREGVIRHPASARQARFGELAEAASRLTPPTSVTLKNPQDFRLIGRHTKRLDVAAKTNGTAQFTQDVFLPGMLVAVVAHAPRFGATVKSFDERAAKAIKGVVDVVQIPRGVAVLAKNTWAAKKGRDALTVEWDDAAAFKGSSEDLLARFKTLAEQPGTVAKQSGDFAQASASASKVMRAAFDFPYLAHAPMEPLNCVIELKPDGCELWYGAQMQTGDQAALAHFFGFKMDQVKLNMLYAGGSFGRRASKAADYVLEAAQIVKAIKGRAPVKLVWLREDDMRGGYYRPLFHHTIEAALDATGQITGWQHRMVGQSIVAGSPLAGLIKNGIDPLSVEGATTLPYAIPALRVELHSPADIPVTVNWWRSVGSSHTAFSTEVFIDEIASATGQDPVALRLKLLADHPRHAAVLKLAAEKAGWGTPLKAAPGVRRGRGVALHESFKSYVAQVVEITVAKDGSINVDRVVCAVDCGTPVNPDNIRAQAEGGVGFALGAALHEAITLKDGLVEQGNFDSFPLLRMNEMPLVQTHIVPSTAAPTGIGEPVVPPLAPALANAIAAATGKRLRQLPFKTAELAV